VTTLARWRDALLEAMIPSPGGGLPALADVERRDFWPRFERAAPLPLRAGLLVATLLLGGVAPFLLGYRRAFVALDPAARDDVLRRAQRLPGAAPLLLVVKLVACFAYFDDPAVQASARGDGPR